MKTSMAAVALLLLSEAALCSSWSYIGTSEQNASFIESAAISDEGQDTKGFWVAMVTADKAPPFDTAVTYMQAKCRKRQIRAVQSDFYLQGKRKGGDAVSAPWQRVIPDTIGESFLLFACQKYDPMNYTIPDTPVMELWKIAQPLIEKRK